MSHYEKRLEADLTKIRGEVEGIGKRVQEAHKRAIHALLTGNRPLAYETILGDLAINRDVRAIDRACHGFVARHLPSAGHLRFVSSVLRLNIELERIGDYAVTICREAVQLSEELPPAVARDIELMADQSQRALTQALAAWRDSNAELARGTLGMATQAKGTSDKVFTDLLREGGEESRPQKALFAYLVIVDRLARMAAQAKNICEETLFAVAGEVKAPKVYHILFVDEKNDCQSQLAEAYAKKAFPESGRYASAGWKPAESLEPRCLLFMDRHSVSTDGLEPTLLEPVHDELASFQVIVSLGGDLRPHLREIPFHTVLLEWDVGPGIGGLDQERAEQLLAEMYKRIAAQVGELMETLRGEGAS